MKLLAASIWSVVGIAGAEAAPRVCSSVSCLLHAAPAPSIGGSVPAALVMGGVLLGAWLLKSRRRT
jgi:hypothetical protein